MGHDPACPFRPSIGDKVSRKGPSHIDFAVSKVDHQQNAVDQRVAKGDQGVNAALRQARHYQAHPLAERIFARHQRSGCANDHQDNNDKRRRH